MDPIRSFPAPSRTRKLAKTFQKVINPKTTSKKHLSSRFNCLLNPEENFRCFESQEFHKEYAEEAKDESRNRAAIEAFIAKLFATVSAVKAAYAELQMAQFPYDDEALKFADQAVVDELKAISELKYSFMNQDFDSSPPHVTLMLAEIQEQQSLMMTYEITMKKMQREVENKNSHVESLQEKLQEIIRCNKSLEKKLNASGPFSILDNVKFSDANHTDFILVLQYSVRSIRNFVKFLIKEMESANWDIESAANAIQPGIIFSKSDHKAFAFESFICREIFNGFNNPTFSLIEQSLPGEIYHRRIFFFEQFRNLRAVSVIQFLKKNPDCLFGKFLKSKYLSLVHPKMEFSFFGNLNQRKMVNSREFPETEFFKMFAEMVGRVWLLHCLAFSFDIVVCGFQVKKGSRFSEVYMEIVSEILFTAADIELQVAFMVVPGFKVGRAVVQSQVYLAPGHSPSKS